MKPSLRFHATASALLVTGHVALATVTDVRPNPEAPEVAPALSNFTMQKRDLAGTPAILVDGVFHGDHLDVRVLRTATGDLDRDGREDGVALVLENSGGSGNFRTLCLLLNDGQKMVHVDSANVGDRVRITDLGIDDEGVITVHYLDRAPGEAFAVAPHLKKRVQYEVERRTLKLNKEEQHE